MQRSIVPGTHDDTQNDVNLTPMLDVVFILLIFFIVVASFVQEVGLDLNRSDGHREPVSVDESILVVIGEDNGIWIEGRQIDPRAVKANIARLHAERPGSKVVIQADRRSSNKTLVRVMDASRQAGVYGIALAAAE